MDTLARVSVIFHTGDNCYDFFWPWWLIWMCVQPTMETKTVYRLVMGKVKVGFLAHLSSAQDELL